MPKVIDKERNSLVVLLKDKKGKTFREIARLVNRAVSTVHEIYTNEKKRSALTK